MFHRAAVSMGGREIININKKEVTLYENSRDRRFTVGKFKR